MGLAWVHSRAVKAMQSPAVVVEVHMANGLPQFTLVGLADTEVKEARERVRAAILNSGLEFPHNQRITCNLAPADLPKDSGRFDLPIALGVLAASGQIDASRLQEYEFAGELSLSGDLRPARAALAMALSSTRQPSDADTPQRALVLPWESAIEASWCPHRTVYGARHLLDVVAALRSSTSTSQADSPPVPEGWCRMQPPAPKRDSENVPDLSDVKGHSGARRALEIAAAGEHSLLMVGPPGSGKSMLAQRFAGLLPPLSTQEALESAAMLSLAGQFDPKRFGQRYTRSPHHTASAVALVGGGNHPRPGEISLAHRGVLFLDELPEFTRSALEALREPLETGRISISRASHQVEFDAAFQLIAAMNPCPCGHLGSSLTTCRCTPEQINRYQGRLSGPLLERIDLQITVQSLTGQELLSRQSVGDSSARVRERVMAARERALERQSRSNRHIGPSELDEVCALDPAATQFLQQASTRLGWSSRRTHRAMKVARTIADLADCASVQIPHLAEALQYQRALPEARR